MAVELRVLLAAGLVVKDRRHHCRVFPILPTMATAGEQIILLDAF